VNHIAVIAPHPDDEAIGCGGVICRHTARGDRVTTIFLSSGELGLPTLAREEAWRVREEEAWRAAEVMGIAQLHFFRFPDYRVDECVRDAAAQLQPILAPVKWDRIYAPHARESHPDHLAALEVLLLALGANEQSATIFGYEVWTPLAEYDHIEDISDVMVRKLQAVRCYASQLEEFRYDRAVRGLNAYRGVMGARCRYAEAYELIEQNDVGELARQAYERHL
jgi:LmbE family N-acetylglucosaminyl deacetylase